MEELKLSFFLWESEGTFGKIKIEYKIERGRYGSNYIVRMQDSESTETFHPIPKEIGAKMYNAGYFLASFGYEFWVNSA